MYATNDIRWDAWGRRFSLHIPKARGKPWKLTGEAQRAFDEDVWELYDGSSDYSQAHDLSREMPEKLHELQRLWLIEAAKYNVLPLDDRYNERINPKLAGRPDYITGNEQSPVPGDEAPPARQAS